MATNNMKNFHKSVKGIFGNQAGASGTNSFSARIEDMSISTQEMLLEQRQTNKYLDEMLKGQKKTHKGLKNLDGGLMDTIMDTLTIAGATTIGAAFASSKLLGKKYTNMAMAPIRAIYTKTAIPSVVGFFSSTTQKASMFIKSAGTSLTLKMGQITNTLTKGSAKVLSSMSWVAKSLPRVLGKLFLPITALMGIVDGFKGYKNAESILGKSSVSVADRVMTSIGSAVNGVLLGIPDWIASKFGAKNLSSFLVGSKDVVAKAGAGMTKFFGALGTSVSNTITNMWDSIPSWSELKPSLPNIGQTIMDGMYYMGDYIKSSVHDMFSSGVDWVKKRISGIFDWSSDGDVKSPQTNRRQRRDRSMFEPSSHSSTIKSSSRTKLTPPTSQRLRGPSSSNVNTIVKTNLAASGNPTLASASMLSLNQTSAAQESNKLYAAADPATRQAMSQVVQITEYAAHKLVENDAAAKKAARNAELEEGNRSAMYYGGSYGPAGNVGSFGTSTGARGRYERRTGENYPSSSSSTTGKVAGKQAPPKAKSIFDEQGIGAPSLQGMTPEMKSKVLGGTTGRSGSSALTDSKGRVVSTASTTMSSSQRALLDTIAMGDATSGGYHWESPDYKTIVGGKTIDDHGLDMSDHPANMSKNVGMRVTRDGKRVRTTAAGRYQFTQTTWNDLKGRFNKRNPNNPIKDFSPEAQDRMAYYLAKQDYEKRSGRNLEQDLKDFESGKLDARTMGSYVDKYLGGSGKQTNTTWEAFRHKSEAEVGNALASNLQRNKGYETPTLTDTMFTNRSLATTGKLQAPTLPQIGSDARSNTVQDQGTLAGIRKKPITDKLDRDISRSVVQALGEGYYAQVYSGGQNYKGEGGPRIGSTRHDGGKAGDVYIYGPDGKRVTDKALLGRVAAEHIGSGRGSAGTFMSNGGIHLDQHTDRAKWWDYSGRTDAATRALVQNAIKGNRPELAMSDEEYERKMAAGELKPSVVKAIELSPEDANRKNMISDNDALFGKRGSAVERERKRSDDAKARRLGAVKTSGSANTNTPVSNASVTPSTIDRVSDEPVLSGAQGRRQRRSARYGQSPAVPTTAPMIERQPSTNTKASANTNTQVAQPTTPTERKPVPTFDQAPKTVPQKQGIKTDKGSTPPPSMDSIPTNGDMSVLLINGSAMTA